MKKFFSVFLFLCLLAGFSVGEVYAQSTPQLQLGLSRDFGYGGFSNDIQGIFTIRIKNPPANLARVEFFIDATSMGEVTGSPYSLQFNTDSYPLGSHTLSAVGYTSDGSKLTSNTIQANFLAAGAGTKGVFTIIGLVFGVIILLILLSFGLPLLFSKGKMSKLPLGTPRKYGIGGGAICPKCGRPFPLRLWWLNLGLHKIDRCPYCGKWSLLRPASLEYLRAAEAAELAKAQPEVPIAGESEAEKLKKELDDSRFQNM